MKKLVVKGWPLRYYVDGIEVTKEEADALFPPCEVGPGAQNALTYFPVMASEALAVHPADRQEAVDLARARGVPTDFTPNGMPIFTSAKHRNQYLKQHGFYDRGQIRHRKQAGKGFKVFKVS